MKQVPAGNKGLAKLPKKVRNQMGYMNKGGAAAPNFKTCAGCPTPAKCKAAGKCAKSGYGYGGMTKKKGYNKGGMCGASNPAARPMKKSK